MASGGFVNFGGEAEPEIVGSSTVVGFEKWIEINTVSQGLNRSADPTSKPAEALAKSQVIIQPVSFSKIIDQSTPYLMQFAAKGHVFKKVFISFLRASGKAEEGAEEFLRWELQNAYIISQNTDCSFGGGINTSEHVSLGYEVIQYFYTTRKTDGNAGQRHDAVWNIGTNNDSLTPAPAE